MRDAKRVARVFRIGGALLAERLPVPLVTGRAVFFPQAFLEPVERRKLRNALGEFFDRAAVYREWAERHRLREPQHIIGGGWRGGRRGRCGLGRRRTRSGGDFGGRQWLQQPQIGPAFNWSLLVRL